MIIADIESVFGIEKVNSPSAWSLKQFSESLQCINVLTVNDTVIGFVAVLEVAGQAELQNISIHPDFHGLGYGELLLRDAIETLSSDTKQLYLEVRVSNFSAIRLYKKLGFKDVGNRKGYYVTEFGREDAILMSLGVIS